MSHWAGAKCQSWTRVYCHSWCEQCDWCVIPIARMSGSAGCPLSGERDSTEMPPKAQQLLPWWSLQCTFEGFNRLWKHMWWPKMICGQSAPQVRRVAVSPVWLRGRAAVQQDPVSSTTAEYGQRRAHTGGAMRRLCWAPSCSPALEQNVKIVCLGSLSGLFLTESSVASMGRAKGFWQKTSPAPVLGSNFRTLFLAHSLP